MTPLPRHVFPSVDKSNHNNNKNHKTKWSHFKIPFTAALILPCSFPDPPWSLTHLVPLSLALTDWDKMKNEKSAKWSTEL